MEAKHEIVQLPNPKTKRWVKIDKEVGGIISQKKSPGCYKGVPIDDSVKCDCGHEKRDHYRGEGQCHWLDSTKCGCTWFHPEVQYCKPLQILTEHRCAECNSRLRHTGRRQYYCSHCRKHYRLVVVAIKTEMKESKARQARRIKPCY